MNAVDTLLRGCCGFASHARPSFPSGWESRENTPDGGTLSSTAESAAQPTWTNRRTIVTLKRREENKTLHRGVRIMGERAARPMRPQKLHALIALSFTL